MVLLLLPFLPSSLRLSLVVQKQIRVVMASAVGHHHCADGAGVDVLDLKKAFDYVDVLGFNILLTERRKRKLKNPSCWSLKCAEKMECVSPGRLY